jgi:GDPmannose 4,6-dehydratase
MFASNGILFNHESPRRGENFISRKIVIGLINVLKGKQECLYVGNLYSKRDWGHAKEFVNAQWKILQHKKPDDFVIATGKNYSVKDLINTVSKCLGIKVIWKKDKKGLEFAISNINKEHIKKNQMIIKQDPIYFRPNEVHNLIGNYNKAQKLLNWQPKINFNELISEMVRSDLAKFS